MICIDFFFVISIYHQQGFFTSLSVACMFPPHELCHLVQVSHRYDRSSTVNILVSLKLQATRLN